VKHLFIMCVFLQAIGCANVDKQVDIVDKTESAKAPASISSGPGDDAVRRCGKQLSAILSHTGLRWGISEWGYNYYRDYIRGLKPALKSPEHGLDSPLWRCYEMLCLVHGQFKQHERGPIKFNQETMDAFTDMIRDDFKRELEFYKNNPW